MIKMIKKLVLKISFKHSPNIYLLTNTEYIFLFIVSGIYELLKIDCEGSKASDTYVIIMVLLSFCFNFLPLVNYQKPNRYI